MRHPWMSQARKNLSYGNERKNPYMNVLVLFDTQFGNTEKIARAIGGVFPPAASVRVQNVRQDGSLVLKHVDLLIVGGPTQRQRMTAGLKAILEAIPRRSLKGVDAAAFDTRYRMSQLLTGSAATHIGRLLKKSGPASLSRPKVFSLSRMYLRRARSVGTISSILGQASWSGRSNGRVR